MPTNSNMNKAQRLKKDEFYTQIADIEKEIKHYEKHFQNKVVYCNCDDPRISNFFRYFSLKFKELGLKKLITTCYKNRQADLFSRHDVEKSICLEYSGTQNERGVPETEDTNIYQLRGDGDFRSSECVEILKQADIVITNPPFSLFREYVAQLIKHEKKFLIVGNINAASYKEIFNLIQHNQLWFGPSIKNGDREFGVPDHYPLTAASCRKDQWGKKFVRVKGVRWFTNLEFKQRYEDLTLYRKYSSEEYPRYDNYNAINVNKTGEIPEDYEGDMGVPITFLDKHNPDQFEIVGADYQFVRKGRFYVKGKRLYSRIVIRHKRL